MFALILVAILSNPLKLESQTFEYVDLIEFIASNDPERDNNRIHDERLRMALATQVMEKVEANQE